MRGRIEYIAREFDAAIGFYERANELHPATPSVLRDLGQARMRVGDWGGARAALEGAVERQRRDPDPFLAFQYSQVLEHFGEFEEASRMLNQAIRRDPSNAGFRHRRGRIAEKLGDRETAVREYEQSLQLEPGYVESVVSLASLAIDDGDVDRAKNLLTRARLLNPPRPVVMLNIEAKLHLRERDLDSARRAIERALAEERDVPSLDLAARIELEAVAAGTTHCSEVSGTVRRYAEEIRIKGGAADADNLLSELASICG